MYTKGSPLQIKPNQCENDIHCAHEADSVQNCSGLAHHLFQCGHFFQILVKHQSKTEIFELDACSSRLSGPKGNGNPWLYCWRSQCGTSLKPLCRLVILRRSLRNTRKESNHQEVTSQLILPDWRESIFSRSVPVSNQWGIRPQRMASCFSTKHGLFSLSKLNVFHSKPNTSAHWTF